MTQEEKQLLIKDLCARLTYWPHVKTVDDDDAYIVGLDDTEKGLFYVHILEDGDSYDTTMSVENFKPYLRPMSSMTKEEREEEKKLWNIVTRTRNDLHYLYTDFLVSHHFDYRGLIPMGLALEATKDMYKTK